LEVFRLANGDEGELLLHLPEAGLDEALTHLEKFLPPRFAKISDPEDAIGSFLLVGPHAARLLAEVVFESRLPPEDLEAMGEREERSIPDPRPIGVRIVRSGEVVPRAFEVVADASILKSLRAKLLKAGVIEPTDPSLRDLLRIEKGRPQFGVEMDSDTLPPEAGVQERSIDHLKGCYTGQEVIVRIRDRGHVNRQLRGVLLGDAPPPERDLHLFLSGKEEAIGVVRSAVPSPGFGQTIALAYVRREVGATSEVCLGGPEGPPGKIRDLADTGWVLVEGDLLLYP
jgi:folate-binding protein YgfZ